MTPCRTAACTALRHCPMLRFAFSAAGGAQLRRPGCAVSHCCADSRRLHCSAALPNAPLRFLRRWRRSAPPSRLCRVALLRGLSPLALLCGTAQCSASLSPPLAALSSAVPVVPCRTAARTLAACIALRHCPMLRFAFSAAGGAQLRIPVTRISVPMEFEPLNTSLVHFQSRALRKNCPRQFSRHF